MSTYDIIMLVILVGAVLFGAWKGLAWQIASIASIVVSYFVALNFSMPLAEMLQIDPPWNRLVAMLVLFLGSSLIIWFIFGRIKDNIKKWNMGGFDKQAGAMVGGITGVLLCMITTMFGVSVFGEQAAQAICHSRSGGYIVHGIDQVTTVVPDEIHEIVKPYVEEFQQKIAHSEHDHPEGKVPAQSKQFGNSENIRVAETPDEFDEFQGTLQGSSTTEQNSNFPGNNVPMINPQNGNNTGGSTDFNDLLDETLNGIFDSGKDIVREKLKQQTQEFIDRIGNSGRQK